MTGWWNGHVHNVKNALSLIRSFSSIMTICGIIHSMGLQISERKPGISPLGQRILGQVAKNGKMRYGNMLISSYESTCDNTLLHHKNHTMETPTREEVLNRIIIATETLIAGICALLASENKLTEQGILDEIEIYIQKARLENVDAEMSKAAVLAGIDALIKKLLHAQKTLYTQLFPDPTNDQ
jgi:hypothetical protein